jgi:hypothetical protein
MNRKIAKAVIVVAFLMSAPAFAGTIFDTGNLVVSVEGCGIETGLPGAGCATVGGTGTGAQNSTLGGYGDNQAAPLTLFQFAPNLTNPTGAAATYVNSLVLPQTTVAGGNFAVSGEYGSSSEGTLQLSGNGLYLTIMGYGINASTFNANHNSYSAAPNSALAQSGSLTNQSAYTPVARVATLINGDGVVNSTTGLYNVFSGNNPRSVYSANGTSVYVSGQGTSGDATGGVFYSAVGAANSSPTSITGTDAGSGSSQDSRDVQIYNGQLYVSVDSKSGSTNRDFVGTLGSGTPTSCTGGSSGCPPVQLSGFGGDTSRGSLTINGNGNGLNNGDTINLSPEEYWFANSTTMYVTDSGSPKNTAGNNSLVGDGGLQKWSLVSGVWELDYTLSMGLNLVDNTAAKSSDTDGTTGLEGLAGELVDVDGVEEAELFVTNYTNGDLDQTYLYGIEDILADTTNPGNETFAVVATAPADSNFKGVSFAPVPEPATFALFGLGLTALLFIARRRKAA